MSELLAPFGDETVNATLNTYRTVLATRAPLRVRGAGEWYNQEPKYFDALLMPLSDDGGDVNMIFGAFFFEWDHEAKFRDSENPASWSRAIAGKA